MEQSMLSNRVCRVAIWSSQRHVNRNTDRKPGWKATLLEGEKKWSMPRVRVVFGDQRDWKAGWGAGEARRVGGRGREKASRVADTQVLWDRDVQMGNWGPPLGFLVLLIKGFRNGFERKCLLDRNDPGDEISEDNGASPGSELFFHQSNWRTLVSPSECRRFPHGTWGQGVYRAEKGSLWGWEVHLLLSSSAASKWWVAVGLISWADQSFPQVFAVTSTFLSRGFSVSLRFLGP